jgi:CheY-like chemotaxis protein
MIETIQERHKILVVDDDPSVNDMFRSLLEFDGHEVQTAFSGEAAIQLLRQNNVDLLITDYSMPGMQGDELAALVKQHWPDLPIIMASGSYANSTVVGNKKLHVDFFLSKPFLMDELREAITWVMNIDADKPRIGLPFPWTPESHPANPDASGLTQDGCAELKGDGSQFPLNEKSV